MNQTSETPPSRPRWTKRRKRLLGAGITASLLILSVASVALFYIRSGRLNRNIVSQVQTALAEYGLRAEVGGLDIAWGIRKAKVHDVKIYNQQTEQLIATIDQAELVLEIPNPFALRLQREVIFKTLHIDNLQAYVVIDEQGNSNFRGLHQPPPSAPSRITFDFSSLVASLNGGTLHLEDRARKIAGALGKLTVLAQPIAGEAKVTLQLKAEEGRLNYEGRETTVDSLDLEGRLSDAGAEIERLKFQSPLGEIKLNGRLDDWDALRYNFDVEAQVRLDETERLFAPDTALQGAATFNGNVNGEGKRYKINGRASSAEMVISDARVRGANVEEITVEGNGERITFSARQATASSIVAQKNQLTNVQAVGLQGDITNGRTEANIQQLSIARLALPQSQLAGITLRTINASLQDGRTEAYVKQVNATRLELDEGQISGIALRDVNAHLRDGRYKISGALKLDGGDVSGTQIGEARGQLTADNNVVTLDKFTAAIFGGTATGVVSVQIAGNGASRLTANLADLKSGELFKLLEVSENPLTGNLNGEVNVTWPGIKFDTLSGTIAAHLSGETTQTASAIPVNGEVKITAQSGAFNVEQLALTTPASQIEATGQLSAKGDSDLQFRLTSTDAAELQVIAYSIKDVEKSLADYQPRLTGSLRFAGRVTGSMSDPTIEGDLNAADVGLRDKTLGSLVGHLLFSPTQVAFENATLAVADGGTAKFSYTAPRASAATDGRLDATLERVNVETLTAAAGLSSQQEFITGVLSGEAHLTGIPDSPTGTATVNLLDGTLAGQAAQLATANLIFDGKTARLERSEIRLAQGQLVADGRLDLKSKIFQLQGNADNIDLGQLVASLNLTTTTVTGVANATFQARGNTDDLGELNVELKAQGQNVTINGRDAGQLSLTAHTNPGGRLDVDLITGIAGKAQPLQASIELRRPGRPIDVTANLTDFDIVPLINAFAPDLASSIKGAVNGRLHVAGPILNEKEETTFDLLRGELTFNTVALEVQGRAINIQTPLAVTLRGEQVTLAETRISGQGIDLSLGGTLGLNKDAKLNFALNGSANLDGFGEVGTDLFLGGTLAIDARLDGTVSEPRLNGEIQAKNLSFTGTDLPVNIENGNGRIVLAGDKVRLENFTALANDGTLKASGTLTLAQLQPKDWRFVATANDVDVLYQGAQAIVNGNFALTGTPEGQLLSGTVNIPEGEYTTNLDLSSLAGGNGSGGSIGLSFGDGGATSASSGAFNLPPINLDIRIDAPNTLLIRNQQINTVASAALSLGGTIDDPSVTGRVGVEGGTIKLRSQRYDISTGTLDFPVGGATPVVNVLTEGDVNGYHVYMGLQGPIDAMDVTLRSDPDLPRAEILSLVATGKTESSTLGSQDILASGLGTAASLLSEEFISQPVQSLLGLSRFQIDPVLQPNANPAARLTVGKQLTRDLAFTYSMNVSSEQDKSFIMEYTLTNRFSALAAYTEGGSVTNGARTNSDFTIEVRGRKRFSLGFKQETAQLASAASNPAVPPRAARAAKPPADVTVNKPEEIKLSESKLRELLPVERDGFSRSLARLGERNLTNYLQEKGYFFATVRSRCDPLDCSGATVKLFYDVQPGGRFDLAEIDLEGTDELSPADVSADLQSKTAAFFGGVPILKNLPLIGGLARGITSDDRIRRDIETIRSRMADLGYRSARVTSRIGTKPDSDDIVLSFQVEPGVRSTLAEVAFKGNSVFSSAELRQAMPIKDKDSFSPTQARQARQSIRDLYAKQGFLEMTTRYSIVDLDLDRVKLIYEINEGSRALIADIEITGETKTREASIARFFDFKPGDTLTPDKIRRTQRDLFATGAFSEVTVHTEPVDIKEPEARHVTVQVTEAKPLLMIYGLGFSSDEGPRGLLQLTNTNLFGRVNTASVRLRASFREQLLQVQYTDPRVLGSNWGATVSAFYDRNTNLQTFLQRRLVSGGTTTNNGPGFGIERFVSFLQTERKFSEITALRLRYSFESSKLFNVQDIPLDEIARNAQAVRLGKVSAGLTRDSRDSALNPTNGQLISLDHSLAARPLGGNEAFNKSFISYQHYRQLSTHTPVLRDSVLAFAGRLGLAAPYSLRGSGVNGAITDADRQLPISERFFSGGATTLRGFQFEQAGPQAILEPRNADELPTLVPLGGDALLVMNFELRYPLTQQLRLVPFYDLGNVFRRVSDMNFKNLTHSIGLGLRFNTPIGPVGVDYGYLLNPPSFTSSGGLVIRQPRGVFHIRFGQTF